MYMNYLTEEFIPYFIEIIPMLLEGLTLTLYIGILSFIGALIIGIILALASTTSNKIINNIIRIYISFFRGTPLLMQVFLFYYGFPLLMDWMLGIPKMTSLILCMSLNGSAYICEALRGAIEGVDSGQYEASIAFGMSHKQAIFKIILPQAAVSAVPTITSTFLDLIKMSSIGMIIGTQELTGRAQLITATHYKAFETYLIAIIIYWILAIIIEQMQKRIERKISVAYVR